ncbi:MAG: eukaryotic translation initiation factor 2A-like [Trebouxia sp. A1-2]|nr:MAG: eukaryotic translation initiation factor 2A-like [Trebouxia sp. A1-2]
MPVRGVEILNIPASSVTWSTDGQLLAAVSADQDSILKLPQIVAVAFSPGSTLLQTFQRPLKEAGNADKNLKLLDLESGETVVQLYQKGMSKESWPALQLTSNEALLAHMVNNTINIYKTRAFAEGKSYKLPLKNVGGFGLSPVADTSKLKLAAWVPEGKGAPGFVGIWDVNSLGKSQDAPAPLARRSFFRANSVRLYWNSTGTALLAITAADVDVTNQSYYGEQKIHYLAADGTNDCLVPNLKDGPIHDAQWSPDGCFFIVVAGFMPAKTVLFDAKCKPVFDLGTGPYNIIKWNPQASPLHAHKLGRFLALCGFGNLPGDITFLDKKADGKCKVISQVRNDVAVTCDWAPDGRHFLTATVAPRLNVDNGYQIWRYTGEKVLDKREDKGLLEASWQPAPAGTYPDLPQSPRAQASSAGRASTSSTPTEARGDGTSSASSFSLSGDANGPGGKLGVTRGRALPPGAAPPDTKAASKNSKRRSKKKGSGAGADDATTPDDAPEPHTNGTSLSG